MKGILFKPDMVKAIVEGRKTQTRRLMKINLGFGWEIPMPFISDGYLPFISDGYFKANLNMLRTNGRYQAGEVVYIKETHYCYGYWIKNGLSRSGSQKYLFRATKRIRFLDNPPDAILKNSEKDKVGWFKRSPLFLSAEAARYFIKILDVRPERLQSITEDDAIAEGINPDQSIPLITAYVLIWNKINPKYWWVNNDWVWRIEFTKVETKGGK